jgi:hypothetical protein
VDYFSTFISMCFGRVYTVHYSTIVLNPCPS